MSRRKFKWNIGRAARNAEIRRRVINKRRMRRAVWRASYPILCTSLIALSTAAHATPLTSAIVNFQYSTYPGVYGLVCDCSMQAFTGGAPVVQPMLGGGTMTLAIGASGLITIVDSGQPLSGNIQYFSTAGNPIDDTQGWAGDGGSPGHGTFGALGAVTLDQPFFGLPSHANLNTTGTLTFSSVFGTVPVVVNDGSNATENNLYVAGGIEHVSYNDNSASGLPAFLTASNYIGIPLAITGNLTETDALGDSAVLSWAGQTITGNGAIGAAIDPAPPPPPPPPPPITLGGGGSGFDLGSLITFALGALGVMLLAVRRHRSRPVDRILYSGFGGV